MAPGETRARHERAPVRTRTRLSSVANAMRLIKIFSDENSEIGISDLAKHLGLAKSTAHRLAATLVEEGMLEQNAHDGKYRLGLALFELGSLVRRQMDITAEAKPFLKALAADTGETLHLAVLDRQAVLYINIIESQRAIRMGYKIGTRAPLHCTAVGKVLIAFEPQEVIEAAIAHGLPRRTDGTITNPHAFRLELEAVRTRGYALEDEEIETGLRSIAAAVRNYSGRVIAAIGIAGPAHRMTKKVLLSYVRNLVDAADAVSLRLGYQPAQTPQVRRQA